MPNPGRRAVHHVRVKSQVRSHQSPERHWNDPKESDSSVWRRKGCSCTQTHDHPGQAKSSGLLPVTLLFPTLLNQPGQVPYYRRAHDRHRVLHGRDAGVEQVL